MSPVGGKSSAAKDERPMAWLARRRGNLREVGPEIAVYPEHGGS
jgi:hypothetical protein